MPYNAKTDWRANEIVTPDDLNRIEKGIDESASPAQNITLYVSASGSDETGTGAVDSPFRTIQKAIDSFPSNNTLSKTYAIEVEEGSYAGFKLSAFKRIDINISGQVQITGNVTISCGRLLFMGDAEASVTLTGGRFLMGGGDFNSMISLGITNLSGMSNSKAIDCASGSRFTATSDVIVANYSTAVKCSHSHIHLSRLLTDVITTGIICECGIVQLGDDVIQADTKFVTQKGGRIYVGSQTKMPEY